MDALTARLRNCITLGTDVDRDGVIRWLVNGSVPSPQIVNVAHEIGLPVSIRACDLVRSADLEYARAA